MTESLIQPESFLRHFCIFDKIILYIDSTTLLMLLSSIIIYDFEFE